MTEEMSGSIVTSQPPPWSRFDTIAIWVLLAVALVAHFWRLQLPTILIYDEHVYVEEAYKYLGGQVFFEVHPPFAITLIVACAWLFGCHSWSWRISSAIAGTALIPITYLLARRMFKSRRAALLSAVLVLCEGMFLEYSRLALINILYLTLAAAAYLAVFRFMQVRDLIDRRRTMTLMAIAILLASFEHKRAREWWASLDLRYLVGSLVLVGSVSGFFFLLTFLPNYIVGWWGGVASITRYYHHVVAVNATYPPPVSHQDSPWWSWPFMLRAYKYGQQQDDMGNYLTVWGGGNPAIWWAALVAIVLAAIRAVRRAGIAWSFLVLGYLMYTAMWIPVPRALYLYSYLPAYYLGILALGGVLDACWEGTAAVWEQAAILIPVVAVSLLGLGYVYGAIASIVVFAGYAALVALRIPSGRFVCAVFVATAIAIFVYFMPLWIPFPLTQSQVEARMWFNAAGLGNWM